MVSIADVKLAKELFSNDAFSGRPHMDLFLLYEGKPFGLIHVEGQLWEVHRRFTLRHLRDFGFGKNKMETLIMDEVHEMIEALKGKNGAPVSAIKEMFSLPVVNSLWAIVAGRRYSHTDPKLHLLANRVDKAFKATTSSGGLVILLPFLQHICPGISGYTKIRTIYANVREFIEEKVEEHQNTYQPDSCRQVQLFV